MKAWWAKNPVFSRLCLFVLSGHLFFFFYAFHSNSSSSSKKQPKLVVRTLSPPPSHPPIIQVSQKKAASPKQPIAIPVKQPKPSPPKKKSPPPKMKKTTQPKPASSKTNQQLKHLEQQLAKLEKTAAAPPAKSTLTAPPTITLSSERAHVMPLKNSSDLNSPHNEKSIAFLINYLQDHLQLPDVGEVHIQLSLHRNGSIEKMEVIKAESMQNKTYLENELLTLSFPHLDFDTSSSSTFLLIFCNKP